jgi:hypothetical protein
VGHPTQGPPHTLYIFGSQTSHTRASQGHSPHRSTGRGSGCTGVPPIQNKGRPRATANQPFLLHHCFAHPLGCPTGTQSQVSTLQNTNQSTGMRLPQEWGGGTCCTNTYEPGSVILGGFWGCRVLQVRGREEGVGYLKYGTLVPTVVPKGQPRKGCSRFSDPAQWFVFVGVAVAAGAVGNSGVAPQVCIERGLQHMALVLVLGVRGGLPWPGRRRPQCVCKDWQRGPHCGLDPGAHRHRPGHEADAAGGVPARTMKLAQVVVICSCDTAADSTCVVDPMFLGDGGVWGGGVMGLPKL